MAENRSNAQDAGSAAPRDTREHTRGSGEDERAAHEAGREPAQRLAPHRDGQTTPQREQQRVDQQPHERDESSSSQQGAPTRVMQQAHDDVQRGIADTSRGEASDATYRRELRGDAPAEDERGDGASGDAAGDERRPAPPRPG